MDSKSSKPFKKKMGISGGELFKTAFLSTNKYFFKLVWDISFVLIPFILIFMSIWLWHIRIFGEEHLMAKLCLAWVYLSLAALILVMISFSLFNRTHLRALKFWAFTKEISVPWLVEGLKASGIIICNLCLLIVPGIIKSVRYTFFSFVVFFDPDYKAGKVSSLKRSQELSQGIGWWIFTLAVFLPALIQSVPDILLLKQILKIDNLWTLYPILLLYMYVISLCFAYLSSLLYFMYIAQHKALYEKEI